LIRFSKQYVNYNGMNYLVVVLLAVAGLQFVSAKVFERCELAEEMVAQGFNRYLLRDWICLIEAHSGRNTSKVMPLADGTTQWGMYQINDNYWCTAGYKGGICNIPCESLLTDDITVASTCAQTIFENHGFGGWQGWLTLCQPESSLPNLSVCDIWG